MPPKMHGAPWEQMVEEGTNGIKRSGRALLGKHGRTATSGTMTKPAISITTGGLPAQKTKVRADISFLTPSSENCDVVGTERFGRDSIGIEISPEYCELIKSA